MNFENDEQSENECGPKSKRYRLLAIDDQEEILFLLKHGLEYVLDCEVQLETDPLKAIQAIKEESFDLVLTDMRMPQMNGSELILEIEKSGYSNPIILLTGDCDESLSFSKQVHIAIKPIEIQELARLVSALIN